MDEMNSIEEEMKIIEENIKRLEERSKLSWTVKDYESIDSNPPSEMLKDRDKRKVDFMADRDILAHLKGIKRELEQHFPKKDINETVESILYYYKEQLSLDIAYLEKITRLPEEFKDFDVDDFVESLKSK